MTSRDGPHLGYAVFITPYFHSEQVQTCCHGYHIIQFYAPHKIPRLLFFIGKFDCVPFVEGA